MIRSSENRIHFQSGRRVCRRNLRTGNVIEPPFATVRLRQRVTKGAGSRQKGLLMAFTLVSMAERR